MNTKLSADQVQTIRRLLQRDPRPTYAEIGRRFNVSAGAIGQLARGETAAYRDPQDEPANFFVEGESLDDYLDGLDDEPEVTLDLPEENEEGLRVGDVVTLRSGSPRMTVERATAYTPDTLHPYITVSYWTEDGVTSARLHPSTVQRVA